MNPNRRRRLFGVGLIIIGVGIAVALGLAAFQENLRFFISPTQVAQGEAPMDRAFRLGGLVKDGSVWRDPDSLRVRFIITDTLEEVEVEYTGILPDLFREGQGIVTLGRLDGNRRFQAEEVLAKHDENYLPPEVSDALRTAHEEGVRRAQAATP